MLGKKITIKLVDTAEFTRRPIAHTCGCMLEVPLNYPSFVELRNDFNAVLSSDIWTMDII
jgi:hypothetical protein